MAVLPDLLLKATTADARVKAANTKPSQSVPDANKGAGSSFAQVYARERQAKSAEPLAVADESVRDRAVDDKLRQQTSDSAGVEKPAVADSGKSLPSKSEKQASAESEQDATLLPGGAGQAVVPDDLLSVVPAIGSVLLGGWALESEGSAISDELQAESLLSQSALQKGAQSQVSAVGEQFGELDEVFADALLASGKALAEDAEAEPEALIDEFVEGLEGPKESRQALAESSAARLNPLGQAIAQSVQAQKPAMVPGQPVQMQQTGWSEAVVDRVMWLSSQNLKSAEIQLDPAELGRMEVRIDMVKDQAQVTFLSPHAGVRDALEGQMQRLREMFSQEGMNLDVNVADQSLARGRHGQGDADEGRNGFGPGAGAAEDELIQGVTDITANRSGTGRGLVDYYA